MGENKELGELPTMPRAKKNQLIQLLELFPDQKWRWDGVSANPNLTMEWITSHPDKPWCLLGLSRNPSLTMELFLEFLLPRIEQLDQADELSTWCWEYLSKNPGLKIAEIMQLEQLGKPEKYKWNWKSISRRSDVTVEMLFPTSGALGAPIAWDYKDASNNPNLTSQVVLRYPELWDWVAIAINPAVEPTREMINHHYCKLKDWDVLLSRHPLLSFPLVLEYFNKLPNDIDGIGTSYFKSDTCWQSLSENSAITIEAIIAHPHLPWNWNSVCRNHNLTVAHILDGLFEGKPLDAKRLSSHPNLPVEFILSEKEKYCDWMILSINPNLTAQLVVDNVVVDGNATIVGIPWNFHYLSYNSFRFCPDSLAAKEFKHRERADLAAWHSLLLADSNSNSIGISSSNINHLNRSSLPTAIAELTLQYFSPFY